MGFNTGFDLIKDILLVLLGWILSSFTRRRSKDCEAKAKCLNKLNKLKRVLEELAQSKWGYLHYDYLKEATILFEDLNVCQTGLLFRPRNLKALITESLAIMSEMNPKS